jgi:hypothetical protein
MIMNPVYIVLTNLYLVDFAPWTSRPERVPMGGWAASLCRSGMNGKRVGGVPRGPFTRMPLLFAEAE